MTDWLLGALLATSGLIVLVLLIREPVRRQFGARVAYGLWLIPVARLLMPTLTETVERPVTVSAPPNLLTTQITAEPMLLTSVAAPQPTLIDQFGGLRNHGHKVDRSVRSGINPRARGRRRGGVQ